MKAIRYHIFIKMDKIKWIFHLTIILEFIININGKVLELDNTNFDDAINENSMGVVMFYAPWCGACKRALPKFAEASEKFEHNSDVVYARVNAYEDRILALRYNIDNFPTIMAFPYTSEPDKLTVREVKEFVEKTEELEKKYKSRKKLVKKKKVKKIPKVLANKSILDLELEDFNKVILDKKSHAMVMFYAPGCGSQCEDFIKVGESFENEDHVIFARLDVTKDVKISQNFNIVTNPTLYWFPKSDKEHGARYGAEIIKDQLVRFINDHTGTARELGGGMLPTAGRIPEMDDLIRKNIHDIMKAKDLDLVIMDAKNIAKNTKFDSSFVNYYIKILRKIFNEQDADTVLQTEYDDINEKISRTKKQKDTEHHVKFRNILDTFMDAAAEIYLAKEGLELPNSGIDSTNMFRDEL